MVEKQDERRKRFFPTISLGNILAIITLVGGAVGVYSTVIADVSKTKDDVKRIEVEQRDQRKEVKEDIKEVKMEMRDLNSKLDRVLFEIQRIPKPAAERIR